MNPFQHFQDALESMYPSLSVFSDINWDETTKEYVASHDERPQDVEEFVFGFPEFLQQKAAQDECPIHLFELAFFELIENDMLNAEMTLPEMKGIHLNPTLSFLNLEFDICLMVSEATKGNIQIIQRPHILCLYLHPSRGMNHVDITNRYLEILQQLEEGPLSNRSNIPSAQQEALNELIDLGLVLEVT
jgi:hypothetical protein